MRFVQYIAKTICQQRFRLNNFDESDDEIAAFPIDAGVVTPSDADDQQRMVRDVRDVS